MLFVLIFSNHSTHSFNQKPPFKTFRNLFIEFVSIRFSYRRLLLFFVYRTSINFLMFFRGKVQLKKQVFKMVLLSVNWYSLSEFLSKFYFVLMLSWCQSEYFFSVTVLKKGGINISCGGIY